MYILIYTLLIVLLGLGNKVFQTMSGSYGLSALLVDFPLIVFTYFGLIAIWGRAKGEKYFSERVWRIYFCAILISIIVIPFIDQNIQVMIGEFGVVKALIAYISISLIMLPYYFGLYFYSFGKTRVWKSA